MSRYFYIVCLSFAIKHCFCYSYINTESYRPYTTNQRLRKNRIHHQKHTFDRKYGMITRPEYEVINVKDSGAQIDVASFIRKPDEYAVDDNSLYDIETKKRLNSYRPGQEKSDLSKNFIDENFKINDKLLLSDNPYTAVVDYKVSRENEKPHSIEDSINNLYQKLKSVPGYKWEQKKSARNSGISAYNDSRNAQNGVSDMREAPIQNPNKKSSLKNFKIPFFSRSKHSQKHKKAHKRKMVCFQCTNKDKELASTGLDDTQNESARTDSQQFLKKHNDVIKKSVNMNREKRENCINDKEEEQKEIKYSNTNNIASIK